MTTFAPGDLAYLPTDMRSAVELGTQDLMRLFKVSRESIRGWRIEGRLPPPIARSPHRRPRWSAAAINAMLERDVLASQNG